MNPVPTRPPASAAHAVRRVVALSVAASVAVVAVCATAFAAVAVLVDNHPIDMQVAAAAGPADR